MLVLQMETFFQSLIVVGLCAGVCALAYRVLDDCSFSGNYFGIRQEKRASFAFAA
jgi:hypothetical protein